METEGKRPGEHILSEAPGYRSREQVTIDASQTILPGDLLGQKTLGAATVTAAAVAGNTGTGAIGTWTADSGAPAGRYNLVCIEPASNAGQFEVFRPDGTLDGVATVAVAYNGTINGTIADATDFVSGDRFTVDVTYAAGNGRYIKVDPTAVNGAAVASAVAWDGVTTGVGETAQLLVHKRDAEVIDALLGFGTLDTNQKAQARVELAAAGIICR